MSKKSVVPLLAFDTNDDGKHDTNHSINVANDDDDDDDDNDDDN